MQVIAAAFERDKYNVKIDGVISSGGLLQLGQKFLTLACGESVAVPFQLLPEDDHASYRLRVHI
jgi:hypothetical protein